MKPWHLTNILLRQAGDVELGCVIAALCGCCVTARRLLHLQSKWQQHKHQRVAFCLSVNRDCNACINWLHCPAYVATNRRHVLGKAAASSNGQVTPSTRLSNRLSVCCMSIMSTSALGMRLSTTDTHPDDCIVHVPLCDSSNHPPAHLHHQTSCRLISKSYFNSCLTWLAYHIQKTIAHNASGTIHGRLADFYRAAGGPRAGGTGWFVKSQQWRCHAP